MAPRSKLTIADLHPADWNPREITPEAAQGLDTSLQEFGDLSGVVYNNALGILVSGHQRVDKLRAAGAVLEYDKLGPYLEDPRTGEQFRVRLVQWDLPKTRAANVAANSQAISGHFTAGLPALLEQIKVDLPELSTTLLLDQIELPKVINVRSYTRGQDDAPPVEKVAISRTGDLWICGEHRVLCGDTTKHDDIARLIAGGNAELVITDPPYGVSYASKNEFLNAIAPGNRIQVPIEHDHEKPEDMYAFWVKAFTCLRGVVSAGCSYYVTGGPQGGDLLLLLQALRQSGFPLRHMLVWAKNNHVLGRSDYHYKHEPILFGWVEGAAHRWFGGHSETSLWEIDKPHKSDLHPTMKPVELYERAMQNSSRPGEIVVDVFGGSGTCLIAAHKQGRRGRLLELDPLYVDVIVRRWQAFAGEQARLDGDGRTFDEIAQTRVGDATNG